MSVSCELLGPEMSLLEELELSPESPSVELSGTSVLFPELESVLLLNLPSVLLAQWPDCS